MEAAVGATTPEQTSGQISLEKKASALKRIALSLGEIMSVMMVSRQHSGFTLPDLQWLVMPALIHRQFLIVHAPAKQGEVAVPGAVILWAELSADVDARISQNPTAPIRLLAQERKSGDIVWLTDFAGDPRLINAGIDRLIGTRFSGRAVKLIAKDKDGKPIVIEHRR